MFSRIRRFIPRKKQEVMADIPLPKFFTIEAPRNRTGFVIAALVVLAGGSALFYFWTAQNNPVQPAPVGLVSIPQSVAPNAGPPATVTAPEKAKDGCCEWVKSSTRSDGTHVEAFWRSKPGCAGGCSLAIKPAQPVLSEKPAVHIGPRGGRYHYSRNGTKFYEHHK